MCRSIKTLRGSEPVASDDEVRAAALQYVRKISGYRVPSRANQPAFDAAVDEIAAASRRLLDGLTPGARSPSSAVTIPRSISKTRTA
jgi:hypothetical protein